MRLVGNDKAISYEAVDIMTGEFLFSGLIGDVVIGGETMTGCGTVEIGVVGVVGRGCFCAGCA